jgi:cytochrome c oxidase subunit 3
MLMKGKFKTIEHTALSSAAIYWHFVDAVWIVVFSVVYLGALI